MFRKGAMRDRGIDITLNNPDHVLSPDDRDWVLDARFGKIPPEEFKTWYVNLLKQRLGTRKQEIIDLARKGMEEDILLKCYCKESSLYCHGKIASNFMNAVIKRMEEMSVS